MVPAERRHTVAVIDLETTGVDMARHTVIQLGGVVTDWPTLSSVTDGFEVKVQFDVSKADPKALEVSCYDPEVWEAEAIHPFAAAKRFALWLSNFSTVQMRSKKGNTFKVTKLGAHNARFDVEFILAWYKRIEEISKERIFFPGHLVPLDTLQLAAWDRAFEAESAPSPPTVLKLGACCDRYGVDREAVYSQVERWLSDRDKLRIDMTEDPHHALIDAGLARALAEAIRR